MNIVGAINKEREYLSFRMKGEEPYSFLEEIKKYGFETIEDFVKAKKDYKFSLNKFEVVNTNVEKAIGEVLKAMEQKHTSVLFAVTDRTIVWNGNGGNYNVEYCAECNISVYPLYTGGGTIVSTPGDLNVGICFPENNMFDSIYILNKFAEIFKKYTDLPVEVAGNDILINSYKILGSSIYRSNGMFMFITPVSMSEKSQIICDVCLKHSTKQPSHIDFMTADQLREEVEKWLKIQ